MAYSVHPMRLHLDHLIDHLVNAAFGGRIVYWREPDGHVWELLTVSYARQTPAAET